MVPSELVLRGSPDCECRCVEFERHGGYVACRSVEVVVNDLPCSIGTYSVVTGTTYEAESGTLSGNATRLSGSSFSGGTAIGYLGSSCSPVLYLLLIFDAR